MSSEILVTGGCGFIGRVLVKSLVGEGHRVTVVDKNVSGGEIPGAETVQAEFSEYARLALDRGHRYDHVIHLAASHEVGASVTAPQAYYHNNLTGTVSLLEAMRGGLSPSIIFSSSGGVYGDAGSGAISETCHTIPVNPYGSTKLACELAIRDYSRSFGLKSTIFRYFNAAGADPSGTSGYVQTPATHAVPILMRSIKNRQPFTVFGVDYPTGDGTAIRDYVHVSDLARAHTLAMDQINSTPNLPSQTFNLGNGGGVSMFELIRRAGEVVGREPEVVNGPRRRGDPAMLVADTTLVRSVLGWEPQYDLDDIISHAWAWENRS